MNGIKYNKERLRRMSISDLYAILQLSEKRVEYYNDELDSGTFNHLSDEDKQYLSSKYHYWELVCDAINDAISDNIEVMFKEVADEE